MHSLFQGSDYAWSRFFTCRHPVWSCGPQWSASQGCSVSHTCCHSLGCTCNSPQSKQPERKITNPWIWNLLHLKISGHPSQPPVANHMVLPLINVLEAEELTLATFQLADLTGEKMTAEKLSPNIQQTSSASGPSKSSLSSSILGAGSSSAILTHLTGSATLLAPSICNSQLGKMVQVQILIFC